MITSNDLRTSPVVFDATEHTYHLDGAALSGITKVIREKLFPDEYTAVPAATLQAAADRGHRIHSALELYDTTGIETDDCAELANYKREAAAHAFLANHIASEYIVSDEARYASGIDKVYADGDGVVLADIKTTYKLNTEYVSWQLSVYAYLFEGQNPGIKVSALYAIWLRGDESKVVEVERKSKAEVRELLYGTAPMHRTDEGNAETLPMIANAETELIRLKREADAAAKTYDALKAKLLEAMEAYGVKKYEGANVIITRKADSQRAKFDSKRLKAEHPDIYDEYTTYSTTKGGILITIKE